MSLRVELSFSFLLFPELCLVVSPRLSNFQWSKGYNNVNILFAYHPNRQTHRNLFFILKWHVVYLLKDKKTPLHLASDSGRTDVCRVLLDLRADASFADSVSMTRGSHFPSWDMLSLVKKSLGFALKTKKWEKSTTKQTNNKRRNWWL